MRFLIEIEELEQVGDKTKFKFSFVENLRELKKGEWPEILMIKNKQGENVLAADYGEEPEELEIIIEDVLLDSEVVEKLFDKKNLIELPTTNGFCAFYKDPRVEPIIEITEPIVES